MATAIGILKYIIISACTAYFIGSFLFIPCELSMVGVSTDPYFTKALFPFLMFAFICKDIAIINCFVITFLIENLLAKSKWYIIATLVASGLSTLLTPAAVVWIFGALAKLQLTLYNSASSILIDPLFMDMIIALLVLVSTDVVLILKLIQLSPTYSPIPQQNASRIVYVKSYREVELSQRKQY